jgi:hypothetical protein
MPQIDASRLVTSQHRNQPKFMAVVEALTRATEQVRAATKRLTDDFNIDTAVGAQLDMIGLWVGITRRLSVPITGAFFSFNVTGLGWNQANWKGPFEATEGITVLDDETYRAVLKAKIGANYWDGTNESLNRIGSFALSGLGVQCYVIDNMDMSVTVLILGQPTQALLQLIQRGVCPPKAAGVRVNEYLVIAPGTFPRFALSEPTTELLAGLDIGSFGPPL